MPDAEELIDESAEGGLAARSGLAARPTAAAEPAASRVRRVSDEPWIVIVSSSKSISASSGAVIRHLTEDGPSCPVGKREWAAPHVGRAGACKPRP